MKRLPLALLLTAGTVAASPVALLDRDFGQDGVLLLSPPPRPQEAAAGLRAIRVASDGAMFLGGTQRGIEGRDVPYVTKLLPSGAADPGFGTNGRFILELDPDAFPYGVILGDIALLGDGRIAFAGGVNLDESTVSSTSLLGILTPDGRLDPAFAGSGYRLVDYVPPSSQPVSFTYGGRLAVDRNDRLLLGAHTGTPGVAVGRIRPDGVIDSTYGSAGVTWMPADIGLGRILLDDTDRLLLAGIQKTSVTPPRLAVARLLADGGLDGSFNGGVTSVEADSNTSDYLEIGSLMRDSASRILVGHSIVSFTSIAFSLDVARLTWSGQIDRRFNGQQQQPGHPGLARISNDAIWMANTVAYPTPDRRIVVFGSSYRTSGAAGLAFVRLREDASYDSTSASNPQGPVHVMTILGQNGNEDGVIGAEQDRYGRLIVAGETHGPHGDCHFVLRLIGDRLFAEGQDPSDRPTSCPTP